MRYFIALLMITAGLSTTAEESGQAESVQGWIGARYKEGCPPNPTIRCLLPGAPKRVIVGSISLDSPAAAAGLQVGDCVTAVGDFEAKSVRSLAAHIRRSKPGQPQVFHVDRDGTPHRINVVVGERRVQRKRSVGLGFEVPSVEVSASLSRLHLNLFNLIRLDGRPQAQWTQVVKTSSRSSESAYYNCRRLFRFSALLFLDVEQESTQPTSSERAPESK